MNTAHMRKRAEMIMKVRCGLLTATQAAKELGVSRKTYYKWEKRGLSALLDGLAEKDRGRPSPPQDSRQQELLHQIEQLRRDNDLLTQKMALKDILNDLKLTTGKRRSEKK
jgi:transposase